MNKPFGMIPALTIPFKEDNSINYDALEQNLNYLIERGVHCVLNTSCRKSECYHCRQH
ncbi:hypothetical protein [Priestia filamentosa]|uniref:hypothetical protein n=1 Tax=Priestia filamentosa TaxID=1402861 RepID=UPI002E1D9159|nr:hypothetical protein [Priestia filamentosa]